MAAGVLTGGHVQALRALLRHADRCKIGLITSDSELVGRLPLSP